LSGEIHDLLAVRAREGVYKREQCIGPAADDRREGRLKIDEIVHPKHQCSPYPPRCTWRLLARLIASLYHAQGRILVMKPVAPDLYAISPKG
jgi:hypothetical protein